MTEWLRYIFYGLIVGAICFGLVVGYFFFANLPDRAINQEIRQDEVILEKAKDKIKQRLQEAKDEKAISYSNIDRIIDDLIVEYRDELGNLDRKKTIPGIGQSKTTDK